MTAQEVLKAEMTKQGAAYPNAGAILLLDALKGAKYAVVKLQGLWQNFEGLPSWSLSRLVEVTARSAATHQSPVMVKTMDGPPIFLSVDDARKLAGAILSAADTAEVKA